jgi:hypothetical protein
MADKSKKPRKKWDYEKKAYVPWPTTGTGTGTGSWWWKTGKQKIYKAKGGRVGFAHGSKRPKGGWKD